ncbi:AMP-binding protein [Streptomyces sp. NRRL F-5126]|uniref:AMP-binding protein n=1 Tax=Streptomyces sp. NRRL F-5126 TaxID=1463857 RepID=UPI0004C6D6AF|nr:AMP-binding protein [Streptomyces sp. NRRL F-5126]
MTHDVQRPFTDRLRELAAADPDRVALRAERREMTRGELEEDSDVRARELVHLGVKRGDHVVVMLPKGIEFVSVLLAAWKVGAVPVPLSTRLSDNELADMLELLNPTMVIGTEAEPAARFPRLPAGHRPSDHTEVTLDRGVVSPAWKAIGSGGSTGRPKIILTPVPAVLEAQLPVKGVLGMREGDTCVIPGPLSHNGPFMSLLQALLLGGRVVLTGRFDAEGLLRTVEREKASWLYLVPTMMSRIWKLPEDTRARYSLDTLHTVTHMGAPCPAWLKQAWMEWLGSERLREVYTSTEGVVVFAAGGATWRKHPGTVGLPVGGEVQVRSAAGDVSPAGERGLIWVRRDPALGPSYAYLGAEAQSDPDGWETVGDIGRLDGDGYLYVEDRESDMMLVGGSNVYPAEVEAALLDHPAVADACVIGLPDDDLGQAPHALVYAASDVDETVLSSHARDRLALYKCPRSYEFVDAPLHDAAGKVRRGRLRAERVNTDGEAVR